MASTSLCTGSSIPWPVLHYVQVQVYHGQYFTMYRFKYTMASTSLCTGSSIPWPVLHYVQVQVYHGQYFTMYRFKYMMNRCTMYIRWHPHIMYVLSCIDIYWYTWLKFDLKYHLVNVFFLFSLGLTNIFMQTTYILYKQCTIYMYKIR
jgi:hypothetical protein